MTAPPHPPHLGPRSPHRQARSRVSLVPSHLSPREGGGCRACYCGSRPSSLTKKKKNDHRKCSRNGNILVSQEIAPKGKKGQRANRWSRCLTPALGGCRPRTPAPQVAKQGIWNLREVAETRVNTTSLRKFLISWSGDEALSCDWTLPSTFLMMLR